MNGERWRSKVMPKKFAKCEKSTEFDIVPEDDSMEIFIVKLTPTSGIHKGRVYYMKFQTKYDIKGAIQYFPFKPPKVQFITKMWHSNIYGNGDICVDILKDKWSPYYNFDTVAHSILALLDDPNPSSAANGAAARTEVVNETLYKKLSRNIDDVEARENIRRDIYKDYLDQILQFEDYNTVVRDNYEVMFEKQ